jgi:hypothetical protein
MSEVKLTTVKDAIAADQAIIQLIEADRKNSFVFPSDVRIRLAQNRRKTKPIWDDYEEQRVALVKRLAEPYAEPKEGEPAPTIKVAEKNNQEFLAEINKLMNEPVDFVLTPLTESDIGTNQVDINLLGIMAEVGLLKIE